MTTQPTPKPRQKALTGATLALAIAIAGGIVAKYEPARVNPGLAYADKLAHGRPTACEGHTGPDVVVGVTYSPEQCARWKQQDLARAAASVNACIFVPLTGPQGGGLIDGVYNLGPKIVCGSTLQRKINAGEPPAAWCPELRRWVYASGVRLRGLENRRFDDVLACMGTPMRIKP